MPALPSALALAVLLLAVPASLSTPGNAPSQPAEDPRAVVREATLAVEGDSAPRVRSHWEARLRGAPTDRAARLGLATIARLTYDYPTSERMYREIFGADSARPDRYAVYARLGLAEGFEERNVVAEARAHFARAGEVARALGDSIAAGEALIPLILIRGRLLGVPVAEATLDSAARLIPDSATALQARIHARRAIIYSLRGRADAQAEAETAIALARRAADLRVEADGFITLGKVLQYRNDFDSARVVLRKAEALYERARDRSTLAASLIWQAQTLGGTGRFGEMRAVMRHALDYGLETHNPAAVADAYRVFGVLGIMMGDWTAAADNLKQAAAISRQNGDSSSVRVTQSFQADVLLAAGDLAGARQLVLQLIKEETQPRREFDLRSTLTAIEIRAGDWIAAERAIAEARAVLPKLPGQVGRSWLLHDEGRLALARGDLATAERLLLQWLGPNRGPTGDQMRYDAHLRLADIYARRGEVAHAEVEAVAAANDLDSWRARLNDSELRVLSFQFSPMQTAAASEASERGGRMARVLGALAAGGRADAAFALAERRRARELRERLVRAGTLRVDSAGGRTGGGGASDTASVTAHDIAAALPDSATALLEFVGAVKGAPTTLFVVQRSGLRSYLLPVTDSLEDQVARLAPLLEDGADPKALERTLGAAVLDSALAGLGREVARLIIVPDGPLHYLPWDALRLADGHFLAERYAVTIAPSAAVVTALWRRSGTAQAMGAAPVHILALGDPTFPRAGTAQDAATTEYRSAFDSAGGLPRLPASADEARLVARYAPASVVRLRARASAAFLKHAPLDSFGVIHIATHALVDEHIAARSALALAASEGESGFVGVGDLAALKLTADLVVLSACRTARGKLVGGEGLQGLTAPLLVAGARSVVATQWRIGDRSTAAFVEAFYRGLADGLPVGDALRAAKLDAIRRGATPREWAGFTAVGDPLVTVPLRVPPPSSGRWWVAAAVAVLALAGIGILVLRRRRAI